MSDLLEHLDDLAKMDLDPLEKFRPCTVPQLDACLSKSLELLISGGNRAGKTYLALMLFASRVLGIPIQTMQGNIPAIRISLGRISDAANKDDDYDDLRNYLAMRGRQTQPLPLHFPVSTPSRPHLYWVTGVNSRHIGQRLYRFMFEPGWMELIPDLETGELRVYNKADPVDKAREKEVVPAEPLFPARVIDQNSWKWDPRASRKDNIFTEVTLTNGAVIRAYSSKANPEQGDEINGVFIDEDLSNAQWLEEIQSRVINRDGWLLWAVWPHRENFALVNLQQRVRNKDKFVQSVQLRMRDNPFISLTAKRRSDAMRGSERNIARRDFGDTLMDELSMYAVDDEIHGLGTEMRSGALEGVGRQRYLGTMLSKMEAGETFTRQEVLSQIWEERNEFPPDWTRYFSIDPSHTRTAILFGVVPPPKLYKMNFSRCVIIEAELVLERKSAKIIAPEVKRIMGNRHYEAFIMDRNYGRQTSGGRDNKTVDHFAEEFKAVGIASRLTNSSFIMGDNNKQRRRRIVREFLEGEKPGTPDVYYVRHGTPHLQREFITYRKHQQLNEDGVLEVVDAPSPFTEKKHDVMAALEYLLAYLEGPFTMGVAYKSPDTYAPPVEEIGLPEMAKRLQNQMAKSNRQELAALTPFNTTF